MQVLKSLSMFLNTPPKKGQNVVQVYQNWFKKKQQQQQTHIKQEESQHQLAQTEKQNFQSRSLPSISVTILTILCFLSECLWLQRLCPTIHRGYGFSLKSSSLLSVLLWYLLKFRLSLNLKVGKDHKTWTWRFAYDNIKQGKELCLTSLPWAQGFLIFNFILNRFLLPFGCWIPTQFAGFMSSCVCQMLPWHQKIIWKHN